jgi:predicted lipid carrier protein YhbT/chorismate mutase
MSATGLSLPALTTNEPAPAAPLALRQVRAAIDRVDDGLVLLLAGRRHLVAAAAQFKREAGLPLRDPVRELQVRRRALALADRLGLPTILIGRLLDLTIADACRVQGLQTDLDQGDRSALAGMLDSTAPPAAPPAIAMPMSLPLSSPASRRALLRLIPPPARLAPPLRLLPQALQRRLFETAMARVLTQPLVVGSLDFMRDRRLGIEVSDLGLAWVIELDGERLRACAPGIAAEATVRGTLTDLLLLASRLEDADTLFFQRRLLLTGDTELGLTARNLLDRLPWESIPLALRIAMNRAARFARAARAAHRGEDLA